MKRLGISSITAGMLVLALAVPTLAWHVDVEKGEQTSSRSAPNVTAKQFGPAGDPFHRVVVKVGVGRVTWGECNGFVTVPDEQWAQGTTLTVDGTDIAIGRGETAELPSGSYVGRWSNSREVEYFDISCVKAEEPTMKPVTVKLNFVGRDGPDTKKWLIPQGCQYRSGWIYMQPSTRFFVERLNGKFIRGWNSSVGGYYGPLYNGFTRGLSCN